MQHSPTEMQACIDACLNGYQACLSTAMGHCLTEGGPNTEPRHFRLMMSCAEICRSAAHFMLIGSQHHPHVCAECAEICRECADDCARIGGMDRCVEACRRCAECCWKMAG
jgi:hypothetical protein